MSLPLTPHILVAAYEFLRETPPYKSWSLPESDSIQFHVTRHKDREGDYSFSNGSTHIIRLSSKWIGHTDNLLRVMAHEMIHLYQRTSKRETPNTNHNAQFIRLANRVCQLHGWDPRLFT